MRGNELLEKMELVDPKYVEAADQPPKKRNYLLGWAAAACLCLAVGALWNGRQSVPVDPTLAPITIPALSADAYGGYGFEGYLYYDISELDMGNPWSGELTQLPVYRNGAYDPTGAGIPTGLNETQMRERLAEAAEDLGLTVISTEVTSAGHMEKDGTTGSDSAPTSIRAETDQGELTVSANGRILYILAEDGLELPEGYSFTHSDTTAEEAEASLSWLAQRYDAFLDFGEIGTVTWGDYSFSGEFYRWYGVYDTSGDALEDFLNFNFRRASFAPNESGKLSMVSREDGLLLAEKLGDYPIITAEEAEKLLCRGHYQTTVPEEFPGKSAVEKVELVYRTGSMEEILMPWYKFYVLLPESVGLPGADIGLKACGIYYVPAIREEYVANMPHE